MLSTQGLVVLIAMVGTVHSQTCTSSQFQCDNGQCTSSSFRCNGLGGGCSDGSDERGCSSCQSGAFLCSNGECIRSSDRCDGTQECTDGSDETGCPQCTLSQFRCDNGQCVSSSYRCNGYRGCSDGSDERGCSSCQTGAYLCTNGQCIRSSDRCDGTQDCTDGSDETGCTQCTSSQFLCGNGRCVSSSVRCNGVSGGCSDGSDERGCSSCQTGAYLCSNGQCIRSSDRCDGTQDCPDGSDETGCNLSSGELRLARGSLTSSYTSGRLEIYLNGQWGTVCDDGWNSINSGVACRQLGFAGAVSPFYGTSSGAGFGSGTGQIWLDDVDCRGTESRLTSCSNRGIGLHNCIHSEDVAVYCSRTIQGATLTLPQQGDAILASQAGRQAGIILGVILGVCFLICVIWVPLYLMCTRVSGCPLFRPYTAKPTPNVPPPTNDPPQYAETSFTTRLSTQYPEYL